MSEIDDLKAAFREAQQKPRKSARADRTLRAAFSPLRLAFCVAMVPVMTVSLTIGLYARLGPYEQEDALRHIYAMGGCAAAEKVGLSGALKGELGYHASNDWDGDGVACPDLGEQVATATEVTDPALPGGGDAQRSASGAKFIRPETSN